MFPCQKRKSREQLKPQIEQMEPSSSPPPQLRHKGRHILHGSSFYPTGRLWCLANLMFPARSHVVQRPLMVVKYNAKLLSYFNCKRGKYKGSALEFKCPHRECVHSNILYISWLTSGRKRVRAGKRWE
jgi:hypothetical protein